MDLVQTWTLASTTLRMLEILLQIIIYFSLYLHVIDALMDSKVTLTPLNKINLSPVHTRGFDYSEEFDILAIAGDDHVLLLSDPVNSTICCKDHFSAWLSFSGAF